MNIPEDRQYTKTHEWVKVMEDGVLEIGLSDFAQHELGDIVFVNMPKTGTELTAGKVFADVESVKAVSDIYSPVNGAVRETNQELLDAPELINREPCATWLIRAAGTIPEGTLLSAAEYKALINQE